MGLTLRVELGKELHLGRLQQEMLGRNRSQGLAVQKVVCCFKLTIVSTLNALRLSYCYQIAISPTT
jgi:hypothetical protein